MEVAVPIQIRVVTPHTPPHRPTPPVRHIVVLLYPRVAVLPHPVDQVVVHSVAVAAVLVAASVAEAADALVAASVAEDSHTSTAESFRMI